MVKPEVQILMSTYNGAPFLDQQIQSILSQTHSQWELLIRDDGSTDNTIEHIKLYVEKYPEKIRYIKNGPGGGSSISFMGMLDLVEAPYCMFCDQDDIWVPDKIQVSLEEIKKLEKEDPIGLVFTDMEVVSEDLKHKLGSFLRLQKLNPKWIKNSNNVLAQSMAAGCTMMFTWHLIKILKPIKAPLFQHDHWVLINASIYGNVSYLDRKTVMYRQHSHNTIGSHKIDWPYFSKKVKEARKIFNRWIYIKSKFSRKVNMILLFLAKLKVNVSRL